VLIALGKRPNLIAGHEAEEAVAEVQAGKPNDLPRPAGER
jgi:hypothetical protein